MKDLTAAINLNEEVAHLAEFIRQKWTPIDNLEALFTEIRDAALHAARGWFDAHTVWERVTDWQDARAALLQGTLTLGADTHVDLYDAICTLLYDISRELRDVREAALALDGDWDFERRVRAIELRLSSRYPDLAGARPLGWAELALGYCDCDGQAEYDPRPDRELFQGSRVDGPSAGFTSRVALPYVMYDHTCQSQKAPSVLVGAVFAHFLGIAEYLNTQALIHNLAAALPDLQTPDMLFERNEQNLKAHHPVLTVLLQLARPCKTKASFEEHLVISAQYAALSEEEKAKLQADNHDAIAKLIARLKSRPSTEEVQERTAAKQHRIVLLKEAFNHQPTVI